MVKLRYPFVSVFMYKVSGKYYQPAIIIAVALVAGEVVT